MKFSKELLALQEAKDDPAKQALAAVDFAYPELSKIDSSVVKESLKAAAIPHWFDESILAALLDIPKSESSLRLEHIRKLRLVEPFLARGENALNVHEMSRLALRKRMIEEEESNFYFYSTRAETYFSSKTNPTARIEQIYHFLCSDQRACASDLESLTTDKFDKTPPEECYAFATAFRELNSDHLIKGRARVWLTLYIASVHEMRHETSQQLGLARIAIDLARDNSDFRAEAVSRILVGDALQEQGNLQDAQTAFQMSLDLSSQLVAQDPDNASWQRGLAVAHSKIGDVLKEQGNLRNAHTAFQTSLDINCQLVAQDSSNASWQRGLAVAHSKIGDVLLEQGNLQEAQTKFKIYLDISSRLVEQDSSNASWQRGLAIAHGKIGDVLQEQGNLQDAQAEFQKYLDISSRLVAQDSGNASWQQDFAIAYSKIGDVLQEQGYLQKAQAAFQNALEISSQLVVQELSNANWQWSLAVAYSKIGDVLQEQGNLQEAQAAFQKYLDNSSRLVAQHSSNASWQRGLAIAYSKIGDVLQEQGNLQDAQPSFQKALEISNQLVVQDLSNANWHWGLAVAHSKIGDVLKRKGNLQEAQASFQNYLDISSKLVVQDPANANWQRGLAIAHSRIGDVLQEQGNLQEAQTSLQKHLDICSQLVLQDPGNAKWQHGLAVAYSKIGDVLKKKGNLKDAQAAFQKYMEISSQLVTHAPGNAKWQRDLAIAHSKIGDILKEQGNKTGTCTASEISDTAVEKHGYIFCASENALEEEPVVAAPIPSSTQCTIKLFLASSSELEDHRDAFDLYLRQQNDRLQEEGCYYLKVVRWENSLDAMSETRLQDEYNAAIQDCDIFVSLFRTKTGKYTEEEFDVAHRAFKKTGAPLIYTFFEKVHISNEKKYRAALNSLWVFQDKLNDLGHFHTEYEGIEHLKRMFREQLDKLLAERNS